MCFKSQHKVGEFIRFVLFEKLCEENRSLVFGKLEVINIIKLKAFRTILYQNVKHSQVLGKTILFSSHVICNSNHL